MRVLTRRLVVAVVMFGAGGLLLGACSGYATRGNGQGSGGVGGSNVATEGTTGAGGAASVGGSKAATETTTVGAAGEGNGGAEGVAMGTGGGLASSPGAAGAASPEAGWSEPVSFAVDSDAGIPQVAMGLEGNATLVWPGTDVYRASILAARFEQGA